MFVRRALFLSHRLERSQLVVDGCAERVGSKSIWSKAGLEVTGPDEG